MFEVSLKSK